MEAESIKIVDIPDTLLDPKRWCINNHLFGLNKKKGISDKINNL